MVNIANPAAVTNAYQAIQKASSQVDSGAAGAANVGKVSFTDMLEDATRSAIGSIHAGEKASAAGVMGTMDPLAITQAVTAARMTLDTVVAVRDAAIEAYNRIQGMPI